MKAKNKKPSKIKQKVDYLVQSEYYNIDYNKIRPEERDAVVSKALKAGVSRMVIGLGMTIVFVALIFWLVNNVAF